MIDFNMYLLLAVALVPLFIGMVWYNPKVFGNAWMQANNFNEADMKSNAGPMWKMFIQLYIFSLLYSLALMTMCIHQFGAIGMIGGEVTPTTSPTFMAFMTEHLQAFRSFKHGALHGFLGSIFIGFFYVGTAAIFEMKSWKYILIHFGYYMICSIIMGGLICQFL